MVVSYGDGQQQKQLCKKMQEIDGNFDHHGDALV
jgi:hypothetical protein